MQDKPKASKMNMLSQFRFKNGAVVLNNCQQNEILKIDASCIALAHFIQCQFFEKLIRRSDIYIYI